MVILRRVTAGPLLPAKRERHSSPPLPSLSALKRPTRAATPDPDCTNELSAQVSALLRQAICTSGQIDLASAVATFRHRQRGTEPQQLRYAGTGCC